MARGRESWLCSEPVGKVQHGARGQLTAFEIAGYAVNHLLTREDLIRLLRGLAAYLGWAFHGPGPDNRTA